MKTCFDFHSKHFDSFFSLSNKITKNVSDFYKVNVKKILDGFAYSIVAFKESVKMKDVVLQTRVELKFLFQPFEKCGGILYSEYVLVFFYFFFLFFSKQNKLPQIIIGES